MNITETKEKLDEWYYQERKILETKKEQETTLRNNHDNPITRHSGFKKTLRKIKQKYYWNEMIGDIKKYVRECVKCQ